MNQLPFGNRAGGRRHRLRLRLADRPAPPCRTGPARASPSAQLKSGPTSTGLIACSQTYDSVTQVIGPLGGLDAVGHHYLWVDSLALGKVGGEHHGRGPSGHGEMGRFQPDGLVFQTTVKPDLRRSSNDYTGCSVPTASVSRSPRSATRWASSATCKRTSNSTNTPGVRERSTSPPCCLFLKLRSSLVGRHIHSETCMSVRRHLIRSRSRVRCPLRRRTASHRGAAAPRPGAAFPPVGGGSAPQLTTIGTGSGGAGHGVFLASPGGLSLDQYTATFWASRGRSVPLQINYSASPATPAPRSCGS